jgi:hypothetical protein
LSIIETVFTFEGRRGTIEPEGTTEKEQIMSENSTWRVIRQLDHYADEETAAMAYQNEGPFVTREDAEQHRAEMLKEQAAFTLKVGAWSATATVEAASRASYCLLALAGGYHDETINANGINWTIREIPGK